MLKWYHYSRMLLATFVKGFAGDSDMPTDQAILQHYGWRSFFIDTTSSASVAAWFAANAYKTKRHVELVEDCWEEGLFLIKDRAWYELAEGIGCIYAISRKALRAKGLNAVDLVEITTTSGRPRFLAQSAFMVGPLQQLLPVDCIVAKILAPSGAFAAYAASAPIPHSMEQLFPATDEDPVLAALLAIPWVKRDDSTGINLDFFYRGLPLPEYYDTYKKRLGPATALYRRFWIADVAHGELDGCVPTTFLTAEAFFHGGTHGVETFPQVAALVRDKRQVIVEIDGLVDHPHPASEAGRNYGKGIFLRLIESDLILLTEVLIYQAGARPDNFGISRGKYFRTLQNGRWQRVAHPDECDCGDERHHQHHFVVVEHFESALADNRFREIREGVFADIDVNPISDEKSLRQIKVDEENSELSP